MKAVTMNNQTTPDINTEPVGHYIHWPVLLYFTVLIICGLPGNTLILYIYHYRMKETIFGFFVQILATVDMTTIVISLPGSFVFRYFSTSLDGMRMCKFLIFMNHFNTLLSGILFSIIAFQRYRKVCHPHGKQITKALARKLCLSGICLAFCLSLPIIFIVGVSKSPTLVGKKTYSVPTCDYEAHIKQKGDSVVYAVLVDAEFVGIAVFLIVVYSLIGNTLYKKMRANGNRSNFQKANHVKKTTKVFLMLTIVFLLSVFPLMIISTIFSLFPDPPKLSEITLTLFDFGVYLPHVNCIANPVIYSFTSKQFRTECLSVCRVCRNQNSKTRAEATSDSRTETTSM
ncbi:somatostatin receptor type 2-like [Haliotis rufescens]|uniref:somatostatin receptor type 2-like n=1 Tax=Haliotis rufescens TaxID=6454 RepID=UPI001EB02815|nr:somatostatin receptor type 2-like [Haliotis rufescens]